MRRVHLPRMRSRGYPEEIRCKSGTNKWPLVVIPLLMLIAGLLVSILYADYKERRSLVYGTPEYNERIRETVNNMGKGK